MIETTKSTVAAGEIAAASLDIHAFNSRNLSPTETNVYINQSCQAVTQTLCNKNLSGQITLVRSVGI